MELGLHRRLCKNLQKNEYQTQKSGNSNCEIGDSMSRLNMRREPAQKPDLKFAMRGGPRHGMACMRNQPEFNVSRRCRGYQLRMPRIDIPVRLAMDQQHRNRGMSYRIQWAGLKQINAITKMCVHNC